MKKRSIKIIFSAYKNFLLIIVFIIVNLCLIFIVSLFAIYQKYIDLNLSIINGLNLAVKNGVILSDLRGSVLDIADSYLQSGIMSSSYLFNDLKEVEIINKNSERCENKKITLKNEEFNYKLSLIINNNKNIYLCFENYFYSETRFGNKQIAHWITGFQLNFKSISSNIKYILLSSLLVIILSVTILYITLRCLDKIKEKELTIDIVKKIKHEINRPISKIQTLSKILYSNYEKLSEKSIKDKLNQIFLLTKTHGYFVNSMFSYALNRNNMFNTIEKNKINIIEIYDYCLNISIKDNVECFNVKEDISEFFKHNLIIMDKTFLQVAILNILTNAYEAVYRNRLSLGTNLGLFKFEFKADFETSSNKMFIIIKNYGSYINENKYENIFKNGVSGSKSTNTGYGLSILRDIVDLYKGEIELNSFLDEINMENSWVCFKLIFNNIDYIKVDSNLYLDTFENKLKSDIFLKEKITRNTEKIFKVIIIDDESHLYKPWESMNPDFEFIYFSHYDLLFNALDDSKVSLKEVNIIITDYYFDKIKYGLTLFSSNFLGNLRDIYGYKGIIALSSNTLDQNISNKYIDLTISKYPHKINELLSSFHR